MATKKNTDTTPLTFDLPLSLLEKMANQQKKFGFSSASELVREAIACLDMDRCTSATEPHKQISVRLPADMKAKLAKTAKKKKVSIGGLLRIAIDTYEAKPSSKKTGRK